jgi:hypothetical protein
MTLTTRMRMTVPTIIVAAGVATGVLAQTTTANPHHPDTTGASKLRPGPGRTTRSAGHDASWNDG